LPSLTFHGVKYEEIDRVCQANGISCEKRAIPRYCANKEQKEKHATERYSGTMYSAYDLDAEFCCYYTCIPDCTYSRRRRSTCGGTSSGCENCGDCSDTDSDDCGGAVGVIVLLMVIVAVIAFLILIAPAAVTLAVMGLDLLLAGIVMLFDLLTLGIFHRYLTRTRVFIQTEDDNLLAKIFYEVAMIGGLPRVKGFWSEGFISVRYGAIGTITGIVVAVVTFLIDPNSKWWYLIPVTVIAISILLLYTGTYNVRKRREEVMNAVGKHLGLEQAVSG